MEHSLSGITASDLILLAHAAFGVTGCIAALWVFVECLNASPANAGRLRTAAYLTAFCMVAAWICGGYWYVRFYPAEKTLILAGPWPFAHNVFMETKEHLFFVTGILALLLPIATREKVYTNVAARKLVLSVAGMIVVTGLALEGAGAIIDHGVKVALLRGPGR
ncbi:MAG TPA: hypothetical protein VG273_10180 [Bryobacteraceae bacterium]|jgi:hypothetical protein|nr:hypothetical protein [Bryobacteraceae bacterium]